MTRLLAKFALVAAPVALGAAVTAVARDVENSVLAEQAERVAVIQKVAPAVVAVCQYGGTGSGSGVIIDPEGYALTNFHVTSSTGPLMSCGLPDGNLYDAVLVGHDKVGDVALVKILPKEKGKPFPFVPMGDSDAVKAGDWSLAMGNPFSLAMDFTPTVTYGLVSGVNRYQPPEGKGLLEYTDCIQIDTSINPGNSGGPLFNMRGELIGINGRGSFEKRGRVNSGVGYAISINQIKNFLGHLYAGIEVDHATLGAAVATADEDGDLSRMVVKQVLDESDAFRRGVQVDDQLVSFAGRPLTSTNQYKNILGIFPKDWRLPLVFRRNNDRKEVLVRLMGNMAVEKPPADGQPMPMPMPPRPGPVPKKEDDPSKKSSAAKFYKEQKGFANVYFNNEQRDKLLAAFKKHGDFAAVRGTWTADGSYEQDDRKGDIKFEVGEVKGSPLVKLKLNIDYTLEPVKEGQDVRDLMEPVGSGGLMMAVYHYHRFLTVGAKGFEGEFSHGGWEPFYPPGAKPAAERRVDCEVIRTKHAAVECKWFFDKADRRLLGFECWVNKDEDPCEVYCSDYKDVGGRQLPHKLEVRRGEKRYATLAIKGYQTKAE